MNIREKQKATVFSPKESTMWKNTIEANISTYEGKDPDGNKKYSSWKTLFRGTSYEKAKSLNDKDMISITSGKIENRFNREKNVMSYFVTIFNFDLYVFEDDAVKEEE